ncbi:thiol reductant ABC exporter subunit CydC [Petropleomorpha daqingensis]|uniref:Thiol reductant ABC exporter CydC subunit n=1 Tax=Petropleomorpha daqingensis TaxID=2026353 RepID=A0A853CLG8_9ACTN|nr:thiol reductant ABC exporter CydC subunit [Petropleomorpha daqingensis]
MTAPVVRLLRWTRPTRPTTTLAVLAGTATVCCGVGLFATAGWLISRAAQHPDIAALAVAVVAVRFFGIGRGVARYAERLLSHDAAMRSLADVRPRVFARLVPLTPAALPLRSGDLLARVVGDVDAVQDLLVRGLTPAVTALLAGLAATGLVAFLFPPAAVLLAAGLLLGGIGVPALVAAWSRRSGRAAAEAQARLSADVAGILDGAADLLAAGAAPRALADAEAAGRHRSRLAAALARTGGAAVALGVLVAGGTVWAVAGRAASATARGELDPVTLAVVLLASLAAFEAVAPLPAVAVALGAAGRSATRLFDVLDAPIPVTEPGVPAEPPLGPVTVRLSGVGVRYAPEAPWALDGVDLDLPPGRRVAVIGASGSGKSTLAALLFRFRDADAGRVLLDGRDVRAFRTDDVRRLIGGIPADPHVFAGTLQQNLQLALPGADVAQLEEVAQAAGLLDWIRSLPLGWSTPVGQRGSRMSGGQRQRLALAQALLADPRVLVLDEPTAHLDPESRTAVLATILTATAGRTTLLVTHDLAALPEMDEVVVLDAGRVAQRGTHEELLAEAGFYRDVWALEA